ncbi:hypothetical protein ACTQ54_09060 [Fundicoccus sp. Sow4_H7]|uniref:hypothetical protein n=1 Tax=Fundicoccus sp. Sow4_H7 TaxID=3438784 RepID=UPI003F915FAD
MSQALALELLAEVIVTGVLSVQFYTASNYTTQDIDLIIENIDNNEEKQIIFKQLGFNKIGNRTWVLDDIGVLIEKVGDSIFEGQSKETLAVQTMDGYTVSFVNVNDIIIDRIKGLAYWAEKDYLDQIIDLITFNEATIDVSYIENNLIEIETDVWKVIMLLFDEDKLES